MCARISTAVLAALARAEAGEGRRRVAQRLPRPVRERGQRVTQHRDVGIGRRAHADTLTTILPRPWDDCMRS